MTLVWSSLEEYNEEFFGVKLPFQTDFVDTKADSPIQVPRVRYFLWNIYSVLNSELILSPNHVDLNLLAQRVCAFLRKNFDILSKVINFTFSYLITDKSSQSGDHNFLHPCFFLK